MPWRAPASSRRRSGSCAGGGTVWFRAKGTPRPSFREKGPRGAVRWVRMFDHQTRAPELLPPAPPPRPVTESLDCQADDGDRDKFQCFHLAHSRHLAKKRRAQLTPPPGALDAGGSWGASSDTRGVSVPGTAIFQPETRSREANQKQCCLLRKPKVLQVAQTHRMQSLTPTHRSDFPPSQNSSPAPSGPRRRPARARAHRPGSLVRPRETRPASCHSVRRSKPEGSPET